jgi:hypothetical protein
VSTAPPDNEFEREKVAFQENASHLRALNQFLWQVPIIAMTLTGGLWYGAAMLKEADDFKFALLLFCGLSDLILIVILWRTRFVFEAILEKTKTFHSDTVVVKVAPKVSGFSWMGPFTVVGCFSFLLAIAGAMSIWGAVKILLASHTFRICILS